MKTERRGNENRTLLELGVQMCRTPADKQGHLSPRLTHLDEKNDVALISVWRKEPLTRMPDSRSEREHFS